MNSKNESVAVMVGHEEVNIKAALRANQIAWSATRTTDDLLFQATRCCASVEDAAKGRQKVLEAGRLHMQADAVD